MTLWGKHPLSAGVLQPIQLHKHHSKHLSPHKAVCPRSINSIEDLQACILLPNHPQSINQSINQSSNQSSNQSINQQINQSTNHSTNQPNNQAKSNQINSIQFNPIIMIIIIIISSSSSNNNNNNLLRCKPLRPRPACAWTPATRRYTRHPANNRRPASHHRPLCRKAHCTRGSVAHTPGRPPQRTKKERERARERERETDRDRQRQTETNSQPARQAGRQTDRQREREGESERERGRVI